MSDEFYRFVCTGCGKKIKRRRHPGRRATKCKECREPVPVEEQSRELTIECSQCGGKFIHERRRGKIPSRCPECRIKNPAGAPPVVVNLDPEVVEAEYRKQITALVDEFGEIQYVPQAAIDKAQEELRRKWCEAYGR